MILIYTWLYTRICQLVTRRIISLFQLVEVVYSGGTSNYVFTCFSLRRGLFLYCVVRTIDPLAQWTHPRITPWGRYTVEPVRPHALQDSQSSRPVSRAAHLTGEGASAGSSGELFCDFVFFYFVVVTNHHGWKSKSLWIFSVRFCNSVIFVKISVWNMNEKERWIARSE